MLCTNACATRTRHLHASQFVAAHVAQMMTRATNDSSSEIVLFTPVKGAGAALQLGGGAALQFEEPDDAATQERRPTAPVPASAHGEGASGRRPAAPAPASTGTLSVPYTPQEILDFASGLWYEVRIGCRPVRCHRSCVLHKPPRAHLQLVSGLSIAEATRAMEQKRDALRKYGLAGSKVLVQAAELGKKSKPVISFDFDEEKLATYTNDFLGIQPEVRMSHVCTVQALR